MTRTSSLLLAMALAGCSRATVSEANAPATCARVGPVVAVGNAGPQDAQQKLGAAAAARLGANYVQLEVLSKASTGANRWDAAGIAFVCR